MNKKSKLILVITTLLFGLLLVGCSTEEKESSPTPKKEKETIKKTQENSPQKQEAKKLKSEKVDQSVTTKELDKELTELDGIEKELITLENEEKEVQEVEKALTE